MCLSLGRVNRPFIHRFVLRVLSGVDETHPCREGGSFPSSPTHADAIVFWKCLPDVPRNKASPASWTSLPSWADT